MTRRLLNILALLTLCALPLRAQVTVQALFEYPQAPDSILSLPDKADWLMQHFWEPMDFKQKCVDQSALNHAFSVYSTPMRWASAEAIGASTKAILKKLEKNPGLLAQFVKAAQTNLYAPTAEIWIDDVMIDYLKAAIKNKKTDKKRKARYASMLTPLEQSRKGGRLQPFTYLDAEGRECRFTPSTERMSLLFVCSRNGVDAMMERIKLQTSPQLQQRQTDGQIDVYYIVTHPADEAAPSIAPSETSEGWIAGTAADLGSQIDLRLDPAIYLIGSDGVILEKNIRADDFLKLP